MMKKNLLMWILSVAVFSLTAADLETLSGKKYVNVELKKAAAGCVTTEHDEGTATIMLDDLPESFIAALSSRQRLALQSLSDIKLTDGTVYHKCNITVLVDNKVTITHVDGTAVINAELLPRSFIAAFTRKQMENLRRKPVDDSGNADDANATAERTEDGRIIYIGPRGGRYYINEAGKRVYIRSGASNAR